METINTNVVLTEKTGVKLPEMGVIMCCSSRHYQCNLHTHYEYSYTEKL